MSPVVLLMLVFVRAASAELPFVIQNVQGVYCPRGYYKSYIPTSISPICVLCGEGYFCPGCPSASFCPASSSVYASKQPVLPPGLGSTNVAATDPKNPNFPAKYECPAGTYAAGYGNYFCMTCRGVVVQNQQKLRVGCTTGTNMPPAQLCEPGLFLQDGNCQICPVGKMCPGGTSAEMCPPGYGSEESGGVECTACSPGYAATNGMCTPCTPGTYQAAAAQSTCQACAPAKYSAAASTACGDCPPGWQLTNDACTACPAGQFRSTSAASCSLCPSGKYSTPGAVQCIACPAGASTGGDAGQSSCSVCIKGYRWDSFMRQCVICGPGTYSNTTGATTCTPCLSLIHI